MFNGKEHKCIAGKKKISDKTNVTFKNSVSNSDIYIKAKWRIAGKGCEWCLRGMMW